MAYKVWLDAGHGGSDCGAVGNGLRESDINLAVTKKVKAYLLRHGVLIGMSRENDSTVDLSARPAMANRWGADAFVSIHCNSATPAAYGIETFCYQFQYRKLADCVHNKLIANTSLYYANRGVKSADFCVIRESYMDAALVEMAFISNERDAQLLINKQEEYAIAITRGILDYLGIAWISGETPNIPEQPSKPSNGEMYRVRKTWNDASSQKGAYSILNNAKANCPIGYSVFDSKGNVVYKNSGSIPTPPPVPSKKEINIYYKVYADGKWYPEVTNLSDYAGVFGKSIECVQARPSDGYVEFRVSPINGNYYPWVGNYVSGSYFDYAGVFGVNCDRLQMRLVGLSGYQIKYRVRLLNGDWLPWVLGESDFAGIQGRAIDAIEMQVI